VTNTKIPPSSNCSGVAGNITIKLQGRRKKRLR